MSDRDNTTLPSETSTPKKKTGPQLDRATFSTSRLLDFCSRKELVAQTGHQPEAWPLVIIKELVDNALDACEEAGTAPAVRIRVDDAGITVTDNGPGIPAETIEGVLDFSIRVSSREAYVAPDRGAQGNALKTIVAMPFVVDGSIGAIEVAAHGVRHRITFAVDPIRQEPAITHDRDPDDRKKGTEIRVIWPDSACSILQDSKDRFLQIAADYAWLNPHLTLSINWFGEKQTIQATDPAWSKWKPSDPTSPHWYGPEHLKRLIAGYLVQDEDNGRRRTVREFVSEFRGLTAQCGSSYPSSAA
jgi:DNA topoisomerase VI subunit B